MADENLRNVLKQIAKLANQAISSSSEWDGPAHGGAEAPIRVGCTIKALPRRLLVDAARTAVKINPLNRPLLQMANLAGPQMQVTKEFIAVVTTKYWGSSQRKLTVSFLDNPGADLRRRILSHMNAWNCAVSFVETSGMGGNVRIARGDGGYWSYLGTDILHIPANRQTMNLQGFTMNTQDSEFYRVVRHETGHTLGFPHEHMRRELVARIDPEKAYPYFWETQGWDRAMVDAQVLTPLDDATLYRTRPDDTSIMCYQLPGDITYDGEPITGGTDINDTDHAFAEEIYPADNFGPAPSPDEFAGAPATPA